MMMSHIIATSQPPPRADPFTAAMIGFFSLGRTSHQVSTGFFKANDPEVNPLKLFRSPPAENHLSLPVNINT